MGDVAERLEALGRLLQDPTSNTAALSATVGIVVLVTLVVVLLLLAFALPGVSFTPRGEETPEQVAGRRLGKRKARLTAAALLFFASLAALAMWYQSTSSVRYCTRVCHQMAEPAATWRSSAHSSVPCTRCHEGRPWLSFPEGVSSRARSLYLYATDGEGGPGDVTAAICIDCHTGLLDRTVTALNGERYKHRDDYEAGRTCRSCHGAQGHVDPVER